MKSHGDTHHESQPAGLFGGIACLVLLVTAGDAPAQFRGMGGYRPEPYRPNFPPNRMPGWDWERTYPWSPYNYGRNPYNPAYYPYVMPYPIYQPYPVTDHSSAAAPLLNTETNQHVMVPHPTGEVKTPPPNAAVVQVKLPERFAQVSFNGAATTSAGFTRYYVTPDIPKNEMSYHYVITAKWNQGGKEVVQERPVDVRPGKTSVVDFTK